MIVISVSLNDAGNAIFVMMSDGEESRNNNIYVRRRLNNNKRKERPSMRKMDKRERDRRNDRCE